MSTVTASNNIATNTDGTRTTESAQKGLNSTYSDFLKLLTVQLTHQDPTQPLDTNQITQQIAMLSQVEQQINTNTNLQQLVSMFSASQTNQSVSYIGKQIDAAGNTGMLTSGHAQFVYDLPAGTTTATVTIKDSQGHVVFTGPGTTIAGRNQVVWDGTNSTTGAKMADGAYTFAVKAVDANNKELTATTYTTGMVSAVDMADGKVGLSIGANVTVPIDTVKKIYTPGANPEA